jgi:hypothetical protein
MGRPALQRLRRFLQSNICAACVACAAWRVLCKEGHLSEAVFVKIVVEMKEEIVFACELNSQSEGVLFLAHYQDLHFNRLQCSHLHTHIHSCI